GVARGYLNRPELTAQRFGRDPLEAPVGPTSAAEQSEGRRGSATHNKGRLYRTGDLGRYLPNGDLEFLGRRDFQVKIRGFRIELGDIESAIAEYPEVKASHVGVRETEAGKAVVAWYVSRDLAEETLRERLAARLPYYMVPSYLVRIDAFPLTTAGKIDRARLPEPTAVAAASGGSERLDDLQALVREVWAATLKTAPATIGLDSQFFHLGGHSLLAALVSNRLTAELGRAIRPKVLFEYPVLADYCEQLRALPQSQPALGPLIRTGLQAAPAESRMMGLMYSRAQSVPDDNMYNIVARVAFTPEMDAQRLAAALDDLLAANPVFRAAFRERDGHIWTEAGPAPLPPVGVLKATEAEVDRYVEEMRREAFGITVPPLWKARIYLLPDGSVTLVFAIHHSLFDGWSLNVLVDELAARYEARLSGVPYELDRFNWFDWCHWAVDLPGSRPFLDSLAYWRKKLSGVEARVELPADRSRKRNNAGQSVAVRFEPATVAKLRCLADEAGITLSPLLFALYVVWIWRISDQEEVVVGYPYAGRDVPGSEQIYASLVTMGFL
ncbi:MAG: AMP-binding protein, partial [Candidatus Sericytochromatia bacterium]|nr:AMP-binding protein [Candidatus Tanganyikabacteria bacterium]